MLTSCLFLPDPTVGSDIVVPSTPFDVENKHTICSSIVNMITTQTNVQHRPQKSNNITCDNGG